jgi:hypothetical protein
MSSWRRLLCSSAPWFPLTLLAGVDDITPADATIDGKDPALLRQSPYSLWSNEPSVAPFLANLPVRALQPVAAL